MLLSHRHRLTVARWISSSDGLAGAASQTDWIGSLGGGREEIDGGRSKLYEGLGEELSSRQLRLMWGEDGRTLRCVQAHLTSLHCDRVTARYHHRGWYLEALSCTNSMNGLFFSNPRQTGPWRFLQNASRESPLRP